MKKQICFAPSNRAVAYFKESAEAFSPVKKVTSFFDNENFLLTKYKLSNAAIHTVLENAHGDTIEFSGLNCGYGGAGPHATAEILQLLGLEKSDTERMILQDGIQISFDANIFSSYTNDSQTFFNGRVRQRSYCGLNLDQHCRCNVITRDVYMINPERYGFNGLLNCLHVMEPLEFEYTIGKDAYIMGYYEIPELSQPAGRTDLPIGTDGVNLIIRGQLFDVKCFIDRGLLRGTLNAVYSYLMKAPLFEESEIASGAFIGAPLRPAYSKTNMLLDLFKVSKTTHRVLRVSDKELKRIDV